MPRAVTIGECMVELAPEGPGLYRQGFAGDTFNAAFYLRQCLPPDWQVDFVTALGTDPLSDRMAAFMAGCGVGTGHQRRLTDRTPGLYLIDLKDGERTFQYWRGQSAARALADDPAFLAGALAGAELILFSGITLAILLPEPRGALFNALARARASGARIAFDSNLRPRLWPSPAAMREATADAARLADIALPSFDDEAAAFGDAGPEDTLERYRAAGCATVVVKAGAGEVLAWDREEGRLTFRPIPVARVVDTTAAGDSFDAAFLAARLGGAPLDAAVAVGAALAARVIGHRGALVAPDTAEVRALR